MQTVVNSPSTPLGSVPPTAGGQSRQRLSWVRQIPWASLAFMGPMVFFAFLFRKQTPQSIILGLVGGACLLAVCRWREMLPALFFLACIEGFTRSSFRNQLLLLMKDFLLIAIYLGFLLEYGTRKSNSRIAPRSSLTLPILGVTLLSLIHIPGSQVGLLGALIGVKTWLLYIPLMYIVYHYSETWSDISKLYTFLVLLAIPISLYGVYQYHRGPEYFSQLGEDFRTFTAWGASREAHLRVYSTFGGPGQFGLFLFPSGLICLSMAIAGESRRKRILGWSGLVCTMAGLIVAHHRQSWVGLGLSVAILAVYLLKHNPRALVCMVLVLSLSAWKLQSSSLYRVFEDRKQTLSGIKDKDFVISMILKPFGRIISWQSENFRLFGDGLGCATPGSRYVKQEGYLFIESHILIAYIELGPLGVVFWVWLLLAAPIYAFRQFRLTHDVSLRWIGLTTLLYVAFIPTESLSYAPLSGNPAYLYYWFLLGIVTKLPYIPSMEMTDEIPEPLPSVSTAARGNQ